MKSQLIKYTDRAILDMVIGNILQLNPWMKLGDRMTGPTGLFSQGKIPPEPRVVKGAIKGIVVPPHMLPKPGPEPIAITTTAGKLTLDDIENFRSHAFSNFDFKLTRTTWIHPYSLTLEHREWLENYDVGDTIQVETLDHNSFTNIVVTLDVTQALIDTHSIASFRFGLSAH